MLYLSPIFAIISTLRGAHALPIPLNSFVEPRLASPQTRVYSTGVGQKQGALVILI